MKPNDALESGRRVLAGDVYGPSNSEVIEKQTRRLNGVNQRIFDLAWAFRAPESTPTTIQSLLLPFSKDRLGGDASPTEIAVVVSSHSAYPGDIGHTEIDYFVVVDNPADLPLDQRDKLVRMHSVFGTEVDVLACGHETTPPRDNLNHLGSVKTLDDMTAALDQIDHELSGMPQLTGSVN